jgi:hypothetical protein
MLGQEAGAVKVALIGKEGPITIHVTDREGPDGSSSLSPDDLQLNLAAGAACNLAFDGPPSLSATTRTVLDQLRVVAVDVAGNPCKAHSEASEVRVPHCVRLRIKVQLASQYRTEEVVD